MHSFFQFLSSCLWPIVVTWFLWSFKEQLSDFINELTRLMNRLKSTNIGKSSFDFVPQIQHIKEDVLNKEESCNTPMFYESQSTISAHFSSQILDEKKLNEKYRELYPLVALNYIFYKIYTIIFGTQIELLYYLNATYQANDESLIEFYNKGRSNYPEIYHHINYEGYLSFIKNNELIEKKNHLYNITPFGRDFIKFLQFEKLPSRIL